MTIFCPSCGAALKEKVECPTCHAKLTPGQKFCSECGGKVE